MCIADGHVSENVFFWVEIGVSLMYSIDQYAERPHSFQQGTISMRPGKRNQQKAFDASLLVLK